MHRLDLLMFHVQSFCCLEHSGVIFVLLLQGLLLFFLRHLRLSDSSLWVSFFFIFSTVCSSLDLCIFNLDSYVLLFFWYPFQVWIWYLVVICFLLVSDMSFCCTFDYALELFPFVLLLCCYVFVALSFLLNLLSMSFLVLFILCKLSCVEPLLTCVGHPLMINSCPYQFYCGNNKSVVWRCFYPLIRTCIGQDLLLLLVQDDVINLIVYQDSLLCYWVSSYLQPGCDVLCRVLEAFACDDFTILFREFHQVGSILFFSAPWPLFNTAFRPSSSSYFPVEILC